MPHPDHVLCLTQDPEGVVHLHADLPGIEYLISRLSVLKAELEKERCEHDHFWTDAWAGNELSESVGEMPECHTLVHHLKVYAWNEEWALKNGFKGNSL